MIDEPSPSIFIDHQEGCHDAPMEMQLEPESSNQKPALLLLAI
jgi:hypothetical protein